MSETMPLDLSKLLRCINPDVGSCAGDLKPWSGWPLCEAHGIELRAAGFEGWPLDVIGLLATGLPLTLAGSEHQGWQFGISILDPFTRLGRALFDDLEIGTDVRLWQVVRRHQSKYPRHVFEYIVTPDVVTHALIPMLPVGHDADELVNMPVRRMRAYVRGSDVFAEVDCPVSGGAPVSRLVDTARATQAVLTDAEVGLDVLLGIANRSGRPLRSIRPDRLFKQRFYRGLAALHANGRIMVPRQADLASEIGVSESTLQRRINEYRLPWPPPWPP